MITKNSFEVICAWCGIETERSLVPNSHGICLDCFNLVVKEIREKIPANANASGAKLETVRLTLPVHSYAKEL